MKKLNQRNCRKFLPPHRGKGNLTSLPKKIYVFLQITMGKTITQKIAKKCKNGQQKIPPTKIPAGGGTDFGFNLGMGMGGFARIHHGGLPLLFRPVDFM